VAVVVVVVAVVFRNTLEKNRKREREKRPLIKNMVIIMNLIAFVWEKFVHV
jgi:hypothetical protein